MHFLPIIYYIGDHGPQKGGSGSKNPFEKSCEKSGFGGLTLFGNGDILIKLSQMTALHLKKLVEKLKKCLTR